MKQGKGGRKKGRKWKQGRKRIGTSGLTDNCFQQAMHYMDVWKDIVSNFERQRKRIIRQNKTGGNKFEKKGHFAPVGHYLVEMGGGNRSNMSYGGVFGNKGARQLQNLTETLFKCEKDVNTTCKIPQPNMTLITRCKTLVDNFSTEALICYNKTYGAKKTNSSDACYCWTHNTLNHSIDELKTCKANKEAAAITAALKNCTTAFGVCRKYEDAASTALSTCASDTSKMTKKAANLAANNASMTAAKEKMASLASSRYHSGRKSRATATSCSEIITISTTSKATVKGWKYTTNINHFSSRQNCGTKSTEHQDLHLRQEDLLGHGDLHCG